MAEQTQTVEFDPETASYEELRARAEQDIQQEQPVTEQPARNERGQFVSQNPPKEGVSQQEAPIEDVDEIVYRKVIDLGDGSGVQVFEAPTAEELIEKLGTAQVNATRKIRELSQAKQAQPEQPKTRTPEEEWLLAQELYSAPDKTFEKLFEEKVGMPVSAFKTKMQRLNAFEQASAEETAAHEFMAKHPEYHRTPANAKKIEKYVRTYGLDGTKPESIEQAFLDLNESGLLEVKPAEVQQQVTEPTQQSRIVTQPQAQQPVVRTTRVSSGLSARRSVTQRSAPEPNEEDLYNMPLDKLRALAISSESQQ